MKQLTSEEQIRLLTTNIEKWNEYRRKKSFYKIDLQGADLQGVDLRDANLEWVNLIAANLIAANLIDANLTGSDLRGADLRGSDLRGAFLGQANLKEVDLRMANLGRATLAWANLGWADLRDANLEEAYLRKANLQRADLRFANLNLAELTDACLYGTAKFGWEIEGVKCDYIYFDKEFKNREPKDRNFEPGEFEQLYKSVPTIEVFIREGMNILDPAIFALIAEKSKETHPQLGIVLNEIRLRGLQPSVVFEIAAEHFAKPAEEMVIKERKAMLENQNFLVETIKSLANTIKLKEQNTTKLIENMGSNINISGGNYYNKSHHLEGNKGNVTIADKIGSVSYNENSGISEEKFQELKSELANLKPDILQTIKEIYERSTEPEKGGSKIGEILIEQGVSILNGLSGTVIFELIKLFVSQL